MQVFCAHHRQESRLTQEQLVYFMQAAVDRLGADRLLTPREVTRDFIALLELLRQNPGETFDSLMRAGRVTVKPAAEDPDQLDDKAFAVFDDL